MTICIMSASSSSFDDVPLSKHKCTSIPPTPSSPIRIDSPSKLTKRVKSVKYSYSKASPDSMKVANGGTTINIVNNFGMGSVNHFTDWKDVATASKSNRNVKLSWCLLRACLGVILIVWAGTVVTVLRSHDDSPSNAGEQQLTRTKRALLNRRRGVLGKGNVRGIKEIAAGLHTQKGQPSDAVAAESKPISDSTSKRKADDNAGSPDTDSNDEAVENSGSPDTDSNDETSLSKAGVAAESKPVSDSTLAKEGTSSQRDSDDSDGSPEVVSNDEKSESEEDNLMASSLTAFGEDVAYSLAHPSVFRTNTPHAPSCTAPLDPSTVSFTLVSQLSYDRIWMIPYHCQRWGNNPISVAVFSNRNASEVKDIAVKKGCSAEHLTVQTVNRDKYDPSGTEYPVNILRNLALSVVKTSHVVYADVDFWPASNLHSILSHISVKKRFASDPYLATVIPAFQMVRQCRSWRDCKEKNIPVMPKDKTALMKLIQQRKASSFDPTNKGGHGSTRYVTWRDQEDGSFVNLSCIKSNRYEPYLVIRYCSDLPPFQEGFTGYGKNKMTWAMQLRRSGYQFNQLGGAFLVHYPHLDSASREEWNKKPDLLYEKPLDKLDGKSKENIDWASFKRARVDALFLEFRKWLVSSVEDEARVHMCDDAQNDDERLWVHPAKID